MSLFFVLLFHFFISSPVFGENQNSPCDCEAIKKVGYCDNSNCIQSCGLQGVVEAICQPKLLTEQMYEKMKEQKIPTTLNTVAGGLTLATKLEKFVLAISNLESNYEKELQAACPKCHVQTIFESNIEPIPKQKACKSDEYKNWRDNKICPKGKNCESEYQNCCPLKKVEPAIVNVTVLSEASQNNEKCTADQKRNILDDFKKINGYVTGNSMLTGHIDRANIEGGKEEIKRIKVEIDKLWYETCADPSCSLHIINDTQIHSNCTGGMEAKVLCTHKTSSKNNALVTYKGEIRCTK